MKPLPSIPRCRAPRCAARSARSAWRPALAALLLCTAGAAQAQASTVRPFFATGLTGGGDDLVTLQYSDGSSQTVTAGGLFEFRAGVDVAMAPGLALRGSFGYHVDGSSARNGSFRFERYPVELIGFMQLGERLRLGLGARKATAAKSRASGVVNAVDADYQASTGAVFEAEYAFQHGIAVYGRGVSERYRHETTGRSVNGDHVAVGLSLYY